jgi:hypothetical protein
MKLTVKKLKQMIKEEITALNEMGGYIDENYDKGSRAYKKGYKDGFAKEMGYSTLQMEPNLTKDPEYITGFEDGALRARLFKSGQRDQKAREKADRYAQTDFSKPISRDNPMYLESKKRRVKNDK